MAAARPGEKYAVAQYDFDPTAPEELTVRVGDRMRVIEPDDGSGWITAELNGVTGSVPASYVEIETAPPPVTEYAPPPMPARPKIEAAVPVAQGPRGMEERDETL